MFDTNSLTMDKPATTSLLDTASQNVIGKPLPRVEGPLKVTGTATYAAEYQLDDMAYGVLVGTKIAAGKVTAVHAESVRGMPGVIEVVTDFKTFLRSPQQGGETGAPPQGVETIAYFGEIVAIVLAETFEEARDAAINLKVEYEPAEGRYDFQALKSEAIEPSPSDQTPAHSEQGDLDKAMAEAAFTIDATYTTPSQNSAAMEPHASIATWDDDGNLTVFGSYQMIPSNVKQLAKALGLRESKVRVVSAYVGGGFGSKLGIAPEAVAAALASKSLGRPVKTAMSRQQVFEATVRRSNTEQRIRLAADADGRLSAIGHEAITSNFAGQDYFEPTGIATHFLYAGKHRRITHDLVELNFLLSGSMRCPGEAAGMLALEAAMDELAVETGVDPVELRKRNDPAADPEKDIPYSSRQLARCLDEGAREFGWADRPKAPGSRREGEWLIGMGVASAARSNMLQESSARVAIDALGNAIVETSMTDIGTGSYTILTQIAAEMLGLPMGRVTAKLGDSNLPPASGSGGSWGAASSGSAVYLACEKLRGKLAKAMKVDADDLTLKDGMAIGDNRSVPLADLVDDGIEATGHIKPGKQEKLTKQASYGAHFCEVGVNSVTGEVRVRRMLGVFAAGRILNEKTARSQCLGGMTFGIGAALTEHLIHDKRNGQLVNNDLAEYHVAVNADIPQLTVCFLDERDIHANPIHAKGLGELGISGAGAAVANAVYNATGVRVRDYPLTLDKILEGLPG